MKASLILAALTAIGVQAQAADIDAAIIQMDNFLSCKDLAANGQSLSQLVRTTYRPRQKTENAWIYDAKGEATSSKGVKLPIQSLLLGVCNLHGNTGYGFASA